MTQKIIEDLEIEIAGLEKILRSKKLELKNLRESVLTSPPKANKRLTKEDIERFSRQIIIPAIGCKGQMALTAASVLIVGAGGLGCPASQYLTGAGVGCIGLVDYDDVECSNLHRQLLHSEESIGMPKVSSASEALKRLYSKTNIVEYKTQLRSSNALDIVSKYDVVVDATDNVATRYLLNDACVMLGKPLVSGSALRLEGQLTVYNYNGSPCYRCLFPKPPPPETVTNCGDGGVLGVVPGVIGVLEALEAIKIVLGWTGVLSGQLLLFSAESGTFRNIRLRGRNPGCDACGDAPTITSLIDYEQFCGTKATDKDTALKLLAREQRISPETLNEIFICKKKGLLIDVRNSEEFDMCAIPHSINVPLKNIDDPSTVNKIKGLLQNDDSHQENLSVYVVCRRGNDSQKAVLKLQEILRDQNLVICDLEGGLHAWSKKNRC